MLLESYGPVADWLINLNGPPTYRKLHRKVSGYPEAVGSPAAAGIAPVNPLSVVSFNSTCLEVLDRSYVERGPVVLFCLIMLGLLGPALLLLVVVLPLEMIRGGGDRLLNPLVILLILIAAGALAYCLWGPIKTALTRVCFGLTCYPIRFNRRNHQVYALTGQGAPVKMPWSELVFYTDESSIFGVWPKQSRLAAVIIGVTRRQDLDGFWEFIRVYMDEPDAPAALADKVGLCPPLSGTGNGRRWALWYNDYRYQAFDSKFLTLLCRPVAWCHILAEAACRRPVWPEWIREECRVDSDDPFARDERSNPPW